ncbi:hypothetical protein WISP_78776 [Willisornis vidua]|uniref:Uncharacterized protein n=1 Tax=Willisornis vidua TaxID=1566151 RepID=A0ABQ9DA08_9PASS|nr:hypothetical protein WISP_78776 [Willisornis vidua]
MGRVAGKLPGGKGYGSAGQQPLNASQQHAQVAQKANGILAYSRSGQQDQGSNCPPVLSPGEATPPILCSVVGHSLQEIEVLECVQRKATEPVKELEHRSFEEWLRGAGGV